MKHLLVLPLLLCGSLLHAQDKAALKEISSVFAEIEKKYETWPHHSYSGENLEGGQAYAQHVWQADDDSGLIRVETLRFDEHSESKTQCFIRGDELLFVLARTETTAQEPQAPTNVHEKRFYFAGGKLIRMLTKEGDFPAGKATDTTALPSKTISVADLPDPVEIYDDHVRTTQAIVAKVASLDAEADASSPAEASPAAASGPAISGDGWRLIQGSRSHYEQFALAWGLEGKPSPEGETDEEGNVFVDAESENLVNYIVNLRTGTIMGKTAGDHPGDKPALHNRYHEAAWSGADTFVAQVCTGKWASMGAQVFQTLDEKALSKGADLLAPAIEAALKKLKGSPQLKKFKSDDFAISLHDVRFVQQHYSEVLQVGVSGEVPKNEEEHSSFDCTVTFTVTEGENGAAPVLTWKSTEVHPE